LSTNWLALATNSHLKKKTMKKIHITLLIILSSVFFSTGVIAQNTPLACQDEEAAGLMWENGRWVTTKFELLKFILVQTKDGLTTESVGKSNLQKDGFGVICRNLLTNISCTSVAGESLYFDTITLKGGRSRILGGTDTDMAYRDTLSVAAFSCTPF
jgi:hypothetical protein